MVDVVAWASRNSERDEISSITAAGLSKALGSVDQGVLQNKLSWYGIDQT